MNPAFVNSQRRFVATGMQDRRGAIVALTAVMMVMLVAFIAFAVDVGYLARAKAELQRTADAAAIAATLELAKSETAYSNTDLSVETAACRAKAVSYAAANPVLNHGPIVDPNAGNLSTGDVVVGYLSNPSNPNLTLSTLYPNLSNSVQVRIRKTSDSENGAVPFFFARILGMTSQNMQASATAAMITNFASFQAPSDGSNLEMLPFALDKQTWDAMMNGGGADNWHWDPDTKTVTSGSDGAREINLYPQGTGAPGNRGTVDIGSANNSTADISRQIVDGVSPSDLQEMGGSLQFDANGHLYLNGDTGISAGVKDELTSIIGKPRIIPIFDSVSGPGNNAYYEIVAFAGVRILDVKLTGKMSAKHVTLQPARIQALGGKPSGGAKTSYYVYSPVWLVR